MSSNKNIFKCPLCHEILIQQNQLALCPSGHGALIKGRYIRSSSDTTRPLSDTTNTNTEHVLHCPVCSHAMNKVNYNNTGIVIDSCTHCPYRWVDRGELTKINSYKGTIDPKGLLILQSVKDKLGDTHEVKEITHYTSQEFMRMKIVADPFNIGINDSTRVIGVLGIWGIAQSILHSKTTRILLVVILIAFAGLALYMITNAESMANS